MKALLAAASLGLCLLTAPANAALMTTILQGESADFAFVSTLHTSSIWNDGAFFALPLALADNNIMGNLAVQLFEARRLGARRSRRSSTTSIPSLIRLPMR